VTKNLFKLNEKPQLGLQIFPIMQYSKLGSELLRAVKTPSFEAETKNDDIKKAKVSLVEESEKPKAEHLDETIASNINQSSDLSPDHFTPL